MYVCDICGDEKFVEDRVARTPFNNQYITNLDNLPKKWEVVNNAAGVICPACKLALERLKESRRAMRVMDE